MNSEQARELNELVDSYAIKLDKIRTYVNDKAVAHPLKVLLLEELDEALENVLDGANL